jgi:penicillin-binding protein A
MRQGIAVFAAAAIVAASLPYLRDHDDVLVTLLSKAKIAVTSGEEVEADKSGALDPPPLTDLDLANIDDRRDVVTAPAHGRRTAELTVDPVFQRAATSILRRGEIFEGAVVMTDIRDGRVLTWSSYNRGRARDIASEATNPTASVMKVITGAALVEAGVPMNQKYCYHGGIHGIGLRDLEPNERRDKACATLGRALGRSLNVVFARLADKHLDQDKLGSAAKRLGFGLQIPFDVPVQPSMIELPDDRLEFARTAAGFWHTKLSPFQGANLAQTVANGGVMIRSRIVDRIKDEEGETIWEAPTERQEFRRALDERTAWSVARMMEQTVSNGTSFKTFHDRAGRPFLPDIAVAGKTGTLSDKKTDTLITWWVGFAPADKPEVALAAVVLNRGPWHIKGTHVASDMLRLYFADQGRKGVRYPPGFRGLKRRKENIEKNEKASGKTASR